ncbi:MAG: cytochrome c [Maribacter sp.]|nr:cytochrome c [Maribacter sp.]
MGRIRFLIKAVVLGLVVSSCEYNVENEDIVIGDCETVISYSGEIRPLIDANCMPCHNGDGNTPFAPDLTTYVLVESIAGLIKDVTESGRMPKEGGLTTAQIEAIKCWVDNGALNN